MSKVEEEQRGEINLEMGNYVEEFDRIFKRKKKRRNGRKYKYGRKYKNGRTSQRKGKRTRIEKE